MKATLRLRRMYGAIHRASNDAAVNIALIDPLPQGDRMSRSLADSSNEYLMRHWRCEDTPGRGVAIPT